MENTGKKGSTHKDPPLNAWSSLYQKTNNKHLQEQLALRDAEIRALTEICRKVFPGNRKAELFDVILSAQSVKCWSVNCLMEGQTIQRRISHIQSLISKATETKWEYESSIIVQPARLEVHAGQGGSPLWIPLSRIHLCVLGPATSATVAVVHQTRLSQTPCCTIFRCGTVIEAQQFSQKLLGACHVVWKGTNKQTASLEAITSASITSHRSSLDGTTTTTTTSSSHGTLATNNAASQPSSNNAPNPTGSVSPSTNNGIAKPKARKSIMSRLSDPKKSLVETVPPLMAGLELKTVSSTTASNAKSKPTTPNPTAAAKPKLKASFHPSPHSLHPSSSNPSQSNNANTDPNTSTRKIPSERSPALIRKSLIAPIPSNVDADRNVDEDNKPDVSPLGRRKILGVRPASPLSTNPTSEEILKGALEILSPPTRKRGGVWGGGGSTDSGTNEKTDFKVPEPIKATVEKCNPIYNHAISCLLRTKYLGDTDLTKFRKVDGNSAQMQTKVDQAVKAMYKKFSQNFDEVEIGSVVYSQGFLKSPPSPAITSGVTKGGVVLGKNIKLICEVQFGLSDVEKSCFAVVHGSIASSSITCSVYKCTDSSEAKRCVLALISALKGSKGPSIAMVSKMAPSPTLSRKRKNKRAMDVGFYGLAEFAGMASRVEHAEHAVDTLKAAICPEKAHFSICSDSIHIISTASPTNQVVLGLDQVADVLILKSFMVITLYVAVKPSSRVYACVVNCANANFAADAQATILNRTSAAVISSLTTRVSQNATIFWNLCTQLKDQSQTVKLERVNELLESLPDDNDVESTFAHFKGFCHDLTKPGLLLRVLFHAGLLDRTDSQGFSVPLCAGSMYDEAMEILKEREAKLQADWKRIEHESSDMSTFERSALIIKTFQVKGLPKIARKEVWWEYIGLPHKNANKRSFKSYLSLAEVSLDVDEKLQILKDVPRTFGHTNYRFSPANNQNILSSLEDILMANHGRKPGMYWQGMSFIAAFILLQYSDMEQAFWVLVGLLDEVLPLLFGNLGPAIENQVFSEVLADKMPEVAAHLGTLDLPSEILCTEWFMCAFTTSVPYHTATQIWDVCILGTAAQRSRLPTLYKGVSTDGNVGMDILLFYGIALTRMYESELLLQDDLAELSEYLKQKLQITWILPEVSFTDSIDGVTDSVADMLESDQTFLWTRYVDAKRNRLNKELEFSSKQMEKLRKLDHVFNIHASEEKTLRIQDFTAICLDLGGAIDENNGILFIEARGAFEAVDVDKSGSIGYDQFLSACRLLPAINNMMQLADLTGDSAVERLRSLFNQHANDNGEISREQLFGLVRTIYIATGQTREPSRSNYTSPVNSRRSSGSFGFGDLEFDSVTDTAHVSAVDLEFESSNPTPSSPANAFRPSTSPSPLQRNKARSRSLNSKPVIDVDDRAESDNLVLEMRRWRTVADRLYKNMDPHDDGRVGFNEFVKHARRSPVFTLAMSLLGEQKPQPTLRRDSPIMGRSDRFQKLDVRNSNTSNSRNSNTSAEFSLSTRSSTLSTPSQLVGNPFFCFSVESESFSARIKGHSIVDGKKKRGRKIIEYEIVISCEFSEEQRIYRTFEDFDGLYKTLVAMSKMDGRLPVTDVASMLNVQFPRKALASNSSDAAITERQRILQGFLDAVQMMQSPEVQTEVSNFLTRIAERESFSREVPSATLSGLGEEDESELF